MTGHLADLVPVTSRAATTLSPNQPQARPPIPPWASRPPTGEAGALVAHWLPGIAFCPKMGSNRATVLTTIQILVWRAQSVPPRSSEFRVSRAVSLSALCYAGLVCSFAVAMTLDEKIGLLGNATGRACDRAGASRLRCRLPLPRAQPPLY